MILNKDKEHKDTLDFKFKESEKNQENLNFLEKEKAKLELEMNKIINSENELKHKNEILFNEVSIYKSQIDTLRQENSSLSTNNFSQEKNITEFNFKLENLSKQLEEKEKNISSLNLLIENLTKTNKEQEEASKSLKITNNKLEDKLQQSINEINKGNDIIKKLQVK